MLNRGSRTGDTQAKDRKKEHKEEESSGGQ